MRMDPINSGSRSSMAYHPIEPNMSLYPFQTGSSSVAYALNKPVNPILLGDNITTYGIVNTGGQIRSQTAGQTGGFTILPPPSGQAGLPIRPYNSNP